MALPTSRPARQETGNNERQFQRTDTFWVPYSGVTKGAVPTEVVFFKLLDDVISVDEIVLSPINEREVADQGKKGLKVNDGWAVEDFKVTMQGNNIGNIAAFAGADLRTTPMLKLGQTFSKAGLLYIISYNADDGIPQSQHVIFDVSVKLDTIPGSQSGTTNQSVTFFAEQSICYVLDKDHVLACELYWDNAASITNSAAPDGALVAFPNGSGNQSFAAPAAVTAKAVPGFSSTYKEYYLKLLNGTGTLNGITNEVATGSIASYSATTLTFGTAPADGSKIFKAYVCTKASAPTFRADLATTHILSPWHPWDEYLGY